MMNTVYRVPLFSIKECPQQMRIRSLLSRCWRQAVTTTDACFDLHTFPLFDFEAFADMQHFACAYHLTTFVLSLQTIGAILLKHDVFFE